MATAGIIGGGMLLSGIASGIGSGKIAKSNEEAARLQAESAANALAASQQFQQQQMDIANQFIPGAAQAQQAQLGLLGIGGDPNAAQNLLNSPLVQAINEQNAQNIAAQGAVSGQSGGNLLTALQDANTATILQAGLGGLGGIAGQGASTGLGFAGLSGQGLGMANQAQFAQGNALGAQAQAQGMQSAIPFLTGANILNQGTQLGTFGMAGGFGPQAQSAMQSFNPFTTQAAPALGGGSQINMGAPIPQSGRLF